MTRSSNQPLNALQPESENATQGNNNGNAQKIDLKLIQVPVFDGTTPDDAIDAGTRLWVKRLNKQMTRAQAINDQTWSDEKKIAILGQFLAGMASDWYDDFTDRNPGLDFRECCKELVNEFKPTLTDPEISKRIQEEHKRPSETYREYASRLTGMANAMEGGVDELQNGRIVLDTFLKSAWPRYTELLRSKISMRTTTPTTQLSKAMMELTELAGSDGKMTENKRRHQNDGKRPAKRPTR